MRKRANGAAVATPALEKLARRLSMKKGRRRIPLDAEAVATLAALVAYKTQPDRLDPTRLAPPGSFLAAMNRHFEHTDIPHALPLFSTVMFAASWLTQRGAALEIEGLGRVRPTLWTIALAESGNAKTLAQDRVARILAAKRDRPPVRMLPEPATAAQWIVDLAECNGGYWFQDEVGKLVKAIETEPRKAQLKPWLLNAYSHQPIGNRLKGEELKLEIGDPHFTFFGLSVFSTWRADLDATSIADGLCQRFNYVVAPRDASKSMFDHFIYFAEPGVEAREARLSETWLALCAQPRAASVYRLQNGVLEFLCAWWSSLRNDWGDAIVPASYARRIGFSVLRYLVALHFLLGKSRYAVDIETARLATRYAEHHLEAAATMLSAYDDPAANAVAVVSKARARLLAHGQDAGARSIMRRLSSGQRRGLDVKAISAILDALTSNDRDAPDPFLSGATTDARAKTLLARHADLETRLEHNERKRNERRLRNLRRELQETSAGSQTVPAASPADVICFPRTPISVGNSGRRNAVAQDGPRQRSRPAAH